MSELGDQVYNLKMNKLITLWIIDFSSVIGYDPSVDAILYLSSYKNGSNNIIYDGNTYEYIGIEGSGFRNELNGQLPEPIIEIDRVSLYASPTFNALRNEFKTLNPSLYFDWRGARITRIRLTDNYLNDPTKAELGHYVVQQVNKTTRSIVEVQLGYSIAADRINNLSIQELAPNRCALKYRFWDEKTDQFIYETQNAGGCPYGNPDILHDWSKVPDFGQLYFDENDNELDPENKKLDKCSKNIKGCQLRFDPEKFGLTLPFTGLYKPVNTSDSSANLPDAENPSG